MQSKFSLEPPVIKYFRLKFKQGAFTIKLYSPVLSSYKPISELTSSVEKTYHLSADSIHH